MSNRNTAATNKVQEYKDELKKNAETLVLSGFPEKILELNELLKSPALNQKNMKEIHQILNVPIPDPIAINNSDSDEVPAKRKKLDFPLSSVEGTRILLLSNGLCVVGISTARRFVEFVDPWTSHKHQLQQQLGLKIVTNTSIVPTLRAYDYETVEFRRFRSHDSLYYFKMQKLRDANRFGLVLKSVFEKISEGAVPCNKALCDLIGVVKPHLRELVENANLVKMWISYMIPKIEDGNNFGVSIQEETLAEVTAVESEGAVFFDQISRYFVARGKLVSKVAKWPHIEDYRRAVAELDEKQYLSLWLVMCEIRNRYCTLHDLVIKNLEKIKKPRSENAQGLY